MRERERKLSSSLSQQNLPKSLGQKSAAKSREEETQKLAANVTLTVLCVAKGAEQKIPSSIVLPYLLTHYFLHPHPSH